MRVRVVLSSLLVLNSAMALWAQVPADSLVLKLQSESKQVQALWGKQDYAEGMRILHSWEESEDFATLQPDLRASIHYNLACGSARLHHNSEALAYLGVAVGEGFKNWLTLSNDADLANLRKDPGFLLLADRVQKVGDHLAILRRFAAYSTKSGPKPTFTYQSSDSPELVAFNKAYGLSSIAGEGTSFDKGLRLMHWVHAQIRHDGSSKNPQPMNGPYLLQVCKAEGRGLNCYGLAVILEEACLSVGLKARMVRCWPLAQDDPDCHVVNAIWSEAHGKWVFLDPTNDAWVADQKGDPLSLQEFRERLIADKPVKISEGANWNGQPIVPKEYFDYMEKNLVRIACPLSSVFGYNSLPKAERPFVTLDSMALDRPTYEQSSGLIVKDPVVFWAKP